MIRNLKALGLALVAVFAISAMTASAASATDFFTVNGHSTAWLTGTSTNTVFTIPGSSSFECTTAKFTATVTNGSSEMTVLPSYTGKLNETPHGTKCTASLGAVTWDVNDCHYKLTGNTTGSDSGTDATVWIECGSEPITTTAPLGCKIKIPSQTPTSGGVTYTNLPSHPGGAAIEVTQTITGITFTSENCAGLVPTHGNDASFIGTMTLTGYEDLGTNSTGTEDPLTTPIEGSQIAISQS